MPSWAASTRRPSEPSLELRKGLNADHQLSEWSLSKCSLIISRRSSHGNYLRLNLGSAQLVADADWAFVALAQRRIGQAAFG